MTKPIFLLDSDQVLAQFTKKWVEVYNERYDDNLTEEEFAGEFGGVEKVVKPEVGDKVYELTKEPGFFQDIEVVDGAVDGVAALQKKGDVYVVSAYAVDPETAKGKVEWYQSKFPSIVDDEALILCKPKFLVYGDFLVDDSVENLELWSTFMKEVVGKDDFQAICFAAPHNVGAEEKDFVDARVENWAELLEYLDTMVG